MADLDNQKVLLGLSGGVDSTTAALLLLEKGYQVVGYYFDVTGKAKELGDAKAAADKLGIELIYEDLSKQFEDVVIQNFIDEYLHARTPNPCVICNPNIKFKYLLKKADEIGAGHIATGHYAKILDGRYVGMSDNVPKDQSYMLYRLGEDVLLRLIFPLEDVLDKEEVRRFAKEKGLENAEKRDSQEICFIEPESNYVEYIESKGYNTKPGNFVDCDGKILGEHKGLLHYTIGQRKGLGIALGKPAFVTNIDIEKNEVCLGDNDELFTHDVVAKDYVLNGYSPEELNGLEVFSKVRYAAKPARAVLRYNETEDTITATFDEAQRAVTPGQSIVYYVDKKVIGGGIISG